jgi:hypothetical protein
VLWGGRTPLGRLPATDNSLEANAFQHLLKALFGAQVIKTRSTLIYATYRMRSSSVFPDQSVLPVPARVLDHRTGWPND